MMRKEVWIEKITLTGPFLVLAGNGQQRTAIGGMQKMKLLKYSGLALLVTIMLVLAGCGGADETAILASASMKKRTGGGRF